MGAVWTFMSGDATSQNTGAGVGEGNNARAGCCTRRTSGLIQRVSYFVVMFCCECLPQRREDPSNPAGVIKKKTPVCKNPILDLTELTNYDARVCDGSTTPRGFWENCLSKPISIWLQPWLWDGNCLGRLEP